MSDALKVGDTLWFVPERGYGQPCELKIASIGRKWMTVAPSWPGRIHKGTLWVEEGGQCYRSRGHYEAREATTASWNRLRDRMRACPSDLTEQRIRQAAALLGVELDAV